MRSMLSLTAATAAAILFLGCGSTEEASQAQGQVVTPTASAAVTPTPTVDVTPTPTPTLAPIATPTPSDAPVATGTPIPVNENGVVVTPPSRDSLPPTPADWLTMSDPALRGLTFRYPPDWFFTSEGFKLRAFDPATIKDSHAIPSGGISLDFGWARPDAVGASKPAGATDTSFAGAPGWELVKVQGPAQRTHVAKVSGNDLSYSFLAIFGDGDADETVFLQILESAQIGDWP